MCDTENPPPHFGRGVLVLSDDVLGGAVVRNEQVRRRGSARGCNGHRLSRNRWRVDTGIGEQARRETVQVHQPEVRPVHWGHRRREDKVVESECVRRGVLTVESERVSSSLDSGRDHGIGAEVERPPASEPAVDFAGIAMFLE